MHRTRAAASLLAALCAATLAGPALATPDAAVPSGFRVVATETLAKGVVHRTLVRDDPAEVVHVATIGKGAPVSLRVVDAPRAANGGQSVARASSLCGQVHCIAAVNGDFFDTHTGELVGGVVSAGRPVRSPNARHHQLTIGPDGEMSAGVVSWRTTIVPTDLRPINVNAVNDSRAHGIVLYSSLFGAATPKPGGLTELTGVVETPRGPLRMSQTVVVRLTGLRRTPGATPIPRDGVVLSGRGSAGQLLAGLWSRVTTKAVSSRVLLRIESTPTGAESIGGAPVLVRHGRRWVASTGPSFVTGRHPRTAVGWTKTGDVMLVTVDGRQDGYSLGMSLPELADLLVGLGADEALNLDGGGSTTFVRGGAVANRPSDRLVRRGGREALVHLPSRWDQVIGNVERPVGNILAIVPRGATPGVSDPLTGPLGLPTLPLPPGALSDPGSNPTLALPALVTPGPAVPGAVVLAVVLLVAVATATLLEANAAHRSLLDR